MRRLGRTSRLRDLGKQGITAPFHADRPVLHGEAVPFAVPGDRLHRIELGCDVGIGFSQRDRIASRSPASM